MSDSVGAANLAVVRGARNPFSLAVVPDPWAETVGDVPEINLEAFDKCAAVLAEVRSTGACSGLLLFGDAGSGKTHLLARLRAWIVREMPESAVFVSVRLDTTHNRIWRHLRRRVVEDLMRKQESGRMRLEELLGRRVQEAESADDFWHSRLWDTGLTTALKLLHEGRHRQHAAAWLRGDPLAEGTLAKMELALDPEDDEALEEQARRVVSGLIDLASPAVVVLSCDQVEALETSPGDRRGLWAYGQMVSALHASARYTMIISSVQSSFLYTFEEAVHQSDWDRIAEHRATVLALDWMQSRRLLLARLNAAPELAVVRKPDSLWPLNETALRSLFDRSPLCLPRKLIQRARDQFDLLRQQTAAIDETIEQFLERTYRELWEGAIAAGDPQTVDDVLGQGLPMLLHLTHRVAEPAPADLRKSVDLVTGGYEEMAICFCNQSPSALPKKLLRIIEEVDPTRFPRQILIRYAGLPIGESARVTRRRLERLRERGARLVLPSRQAVGALDAMRRLLNDARSGDLAFQGEAVEPPAAARWMEANLPETLRNLIEEIVVDPGGDERDRILQEILGLLDEQSIIGVTEASAILQLSEERIVDCARHYSAQVGLLAGPPALVFRFVAESAAGDARE